MRQSLNQGLLEYLGREGKEVSDRGREFGRLLVANDFEGFEDCLRTFLAAIPYQWQGSNGPARCEAWYAGMLYACFRTIGLDVRVEVSSGRGRSDMVVLHGGQVFVFEFKMADGEGDRDAVARRAVGQIRERGYVDGYRNGKEPVHLIGVAFGRDRSPAVVKAVPV